MKKLVCVWPGTLVGQEDVEVFNSTMSEQLGIKITYLEEVKTNPNPGETLEESGGRNDVFFEMDEDDLDEVTLPFMMMDIFPIMNVDEELMNKMNETKLYPQEVIDKYFIVS